MFTLICARINGWVNNHEAGDLRRYRAHYDVIVMYGEIRLVAAARLVQNQQSSCWTKVAGIVSFHINNDLYIEVIIYAYFINVKFWLTHCAEVLKYISLDSRYFSHASLNSPFREEKKKWSPLRNGHFSPPPAWMQRERASAVNSWILILTVRWGMIPTERCFWSWILHCITSAIIACNYVTTSLCIYDECRFKWI